MADLLLSQEGAGVAYRATGNAKRVARRPSHSAWVETLERWAVFYTRIALGAAFLAGIASRFELYGKDVGYGNVENFIRYTAEVKGRGLLGVLRLREGSAPRALSNRPAESWLVNAATSLPSSTPSSSPATKPPVPSSEPPAAAGTADWLLVTLPGIIWGASFLFIAEGLRAVGPNGVTFVRVLVGFLTLALVPAARRPMAKSDRGATALLGLVWMAFPLSMFPFAEQRVSSALTGMLNAAVPLFAAIVATVLARRLPSRGVAVGLAVGMTGALLMAWPTLHEGRSSVVGVLLILSALVSYGFAINLARPLQQRNGALAVVWRAQAAALVLTAPLGIPDLLHGRWAIGPLLALLALGVLGTGVAFVIITMAAGRVGSTRASATAFLIPPVALVLGVLVRHEHVAALSILGAAVCVAGAWLMNRGRS